MLWLTPDYIFRTKKFLFSYSPCKTLLKCALLKLIPLVHELISNNNHKGAVFYNYLTKWRGSSSLDAPAHSFFFFDVDRYRSEMSLIPPPGPRIAARSIFHFGHHVGRKQWAVLFSCWIKHHECMVGIKNNKYYKSNMSWCLFSVNGLILPLSLSVFLHEGLLFIRVTDEQCFRCCHFN